MNCQTCCKIFCSRRDQEENCSEKITYVEAGILEKVKVDKIRMDIEQDIKRCKELIKPEHANWIGISNQKAIEHVLVEREENKKKIKELEEENLHWKKQYHLVTRKIDVIPKQKIKDKIKEMEKEAETNFNWQDEIYYTIGEFEKLLEDK